MGRRMGGGGGGGGEGGEGETERLSEEEEGIANPQAWLESGFVLWESTVGGVGAGEAPRLPKAAAWVLAWVSLRPGPTT